MHPVLIYGFLFIVITISLLFIFEANPIGSVYLLLFISTITTIIIGRILVKLLHIDDPMQHEIDKEKHKQRSNVYQREIQMLFNIVQPDPKYQPSTKRISESLTECFNLEEKILQKRLMQYFGDSFDIPINQSLPDLVEQINVKYKDWLYP